MRGGYAAVRLAAGRNGFVLALRLAMAGGRDGRARFALTAFGVALGVVLLLIALSGQSALRGRAERSAWMDTAAFRSSVTTARTGPALWLGVSDHYAGEPLHRAHVAALAPAPPVPPGLGRLPGPGEVAVSPALHRLLATTPADRLGDRFPGRVTQTLGPEGLRHPDQLVAVIGHTQEQLEAMGGQVVRGLAETPFDSPDFSFLRFMLVAGAILLLGPIVIFVVMVTRISAARREQRLAAMRMVGATRGQAAAIAAAETGIAALAGAVLGWVIHLAVRPLLAGTLRFGDYQAGRFFPGDLVLPAGQVAAVVLGVPLLAVVTTAFALGRVRITPLGIAGPPRREPPTARRLLPLLAGMGGFAVTAVILRNRPDLVERPDAQWVLLACLVSLLVGAAAAGPWACLRVGRLLVRYGRRAAALLAGRRIAADPYGSYRAVGGLTLAAFVATLLSVLVGAAENADSEAPVSGRQRPGVVEVFAGGEPESRLAPLIVPGRTVVARRTPEGPVAVRCAELRRVAEVTCPLPRGLGRAWSLPDSAAFGLWSANGPGIAEPRPGAVPREVHALYVPTDGTVAAEERVRTQAARLVPRAIVSTRRDTFHQDFAFVSDLGAGVRLGIVFVLVMAGCSLTIALAGGLIERRRPFALLRASGLGLGELRRVALLETSLPLLCAVSLGTALGLVPSLAYAIIEARPWPLPGPAFLLSLGAGTLAALALTTVALPLLNATTRHDHIRYE